MRVSAGKYKGLTLAYPRSGLRPTKEVTRQAIFNIIGQRVNQARVLDLFCGAGSLGIEALSRGAELAAFVEQAGPVLRYLNQNLAGLENARLIRGDVFKVLPKLVGAEFDIVIADPPYGKGLIQATVNQVAELGLLVTGGVFVAEHRKGETVAIPPSWLLLKHGKYGETHLTVMINGSRQVPKEQVNDKEAT